MFRYAMNFSIYHNLCLSSIKLNFNFLVDSLKNLLENGQNEKDGPFIESIIKGLEIHFREKDGETLFEQFLTIFLEIIRAIEQKKVVNFCLLNIFQVFSLIFGFSRKENELREIFPRIEDNMISLLRAKLLTNEFPL